MTPVLRVIISAPNFVAVQASDVGLDPNTQVPMVGATALSFVDYFTTSLTPPAQALYAALIDASGNVTEIITKQAGYTPKIAHTYLGWPIP